MELYILKFWLYIIICIKKNKCNRSTVCLTSADNPVTEHRDFCFSPSKRYCGLGIFPWNYLLLWYGITCSQPLYAAAYIRPCCLFVFLLAECVPNLADFHSPYLTMGQFIFHHLLYLFVTCVEIGSVWMGKPSICNKHGLWFALAPAVKTSQAPGGTSRQEAAARWQVTVSPVFVAARFPTVSPLQHFMKLRSIENKWL